MNRIDETAAWRLLRALAPGAAAETGAARVPHDPDAEVWLQVDASGRWEASAPVSDPARTLLELYLPLRIPAELVIAQIGQSLDGRIATRSGHSRYVTGPADLRRLHRVRALVDAVVVGAGTVAADDPRLTVREVEGDDPVRVILDPDGRVDPDSRVFTDGAAPTLAVRRATGSGGRRDGDAEVVKLPAGEGGGFDPHALLGALRERGLVRVLVEGGGITISRFLEADALDRMHVTVAPLLIGSGRPGLVLEPIATLREARRPACRHFFLGDDVLFDLDLR